MLEYVTPSRELLDELLFESYSDPDTKLNATPVISNGQFGQPLSLGPGPGCLACDLPLVALSTCIGLSCMHGF